MTQNTIWGALTEKWDTDMYGPNPPIHALLTRISAIFSSQDPSFIPKSQISRKFKLQRLMISKELSSKASIWTKIQFTTLHFVKKFSSLGFQIRQRSVHKPLFSALWAAHLHQNES